MLSRFSIQPSNSVSATGEYGYMNTDRRRAIAALTAAGLLWGTTVPLSKLALQWLPPGWLTFARFGIAAAILLFVASRPGVRAALRLPVLASGAEIGRASGRDRGE